MYIDKDGKIVDLSGQLLVNDINYAPGWFYNSAERAAAGIVSVADPVYPNLEPGQRAMLLGFEQSGNGWVPVWDVRVKSPDELAAEAGELASLRASKNEQINRWRAQANSSTFPHAGKQIACDPLSRSDIDAVANTIALSGGFPAGFPMAWKAVDNSYVMLADVDAFKAMYASMVAQGTANFTRAQALKAQLISTTTAEAIAAIVW